MVRSLPILDQRTQVWDTKATIVYLGFYSWEGELHVGGMITQKVHIF